VKNFDAKAWLVEWLQTPSPAIGGVVPASIANTADGFNLVSGLIQKRRRDNLANGPQCGHASHYEKAQHI